MSESAYRVRRATVDDLPGLSELWKAMHLLQLSELERRVTEFQVVVSEDGRLLGALAMEIAGRQGRVHSESFHDFGMAEVMRQKLWERIQSLATNHGLARLWTRETAPFWTHGGFQPAKEDSLKKLPEQWAGDQSGWLTMKLRDEEALQLSLDKEFARFKEEEQRRMQGALKKTRALKFAATLIAVVLAIFVLIVSGYIFLHRGLLHSPGH